MNKFFSQLTGHWDGLKGMSMVMYVNAVIVLYPNYYKVFLLEGMYQHPMPRYIGVALSLLGLLTSMTADEISYQKALRDKKEDQPCQ